MLRKLAVLAVIAGTAAASFATLGDGRYNGPGSPRKSLLSNRSAVTNGSFSLRSGYQFRSNQVLNTTPQRQFIRLNAVATVQKGRTTYIVPLNRRVGLINNIRLDISNRQFQRQ